jgi:hypothetical protein
VWLYKRRTINSRYTWQRELISNVIYPNTLHWCQNRYDFPPYLPNFYTIISVILNSILSLEYLYILYFILARSKQEYVSIVWNSLASTDSIKLGLVQQKYAVLCFNLVAPHVHYTYVYDSEQLKLYTLLEGRYHLDALFLIRDCLGSKFCPFLLETLGLRFPAR